MSTRKGSGAANEGGVQLIPAAARKVVQSLKEIVNCPEAEIYAALKECNMDINEAASRLLSQDPFHEVKSKREKKKEGRDNYDYRPHGANNSSTRQSRNGADRQLDRGASTPYSASESPMHGKPAYRKENESTPYKSNVSLAAGVSGNNRNQVSLGVSNSSSTWADAMPAVGQPHYQSAWADAMPAVGQPHHLSAWAGISGQISMADIVRMGRPQNKSSHTPNESHHNIHETPTAESPNLLSPSDQWEASSFQPVHNEWPSVEKPAPTNAVEAELHREESYIEEREEEDVGNSGVNSDNDSRCSSLFENELHQNSAPNQSEAPDYEHREDYDHAGEGVSDLVSSNTRNFEQLSLKEDETEGNAPIVIIPEHLQAQAANCSHLSFGSFRSNPQSSGNLTSEPVKSNLDEGNSHADVASSANVDTRQTEYYVDDSLRNTSNVLRRYGSSDASSASQSEDLRPKSGEEARGNPYLMPSAQRINAAFNETSSEMQIFDPFSDAIQYSNSLPSALLTGNVRSVRESDLQFSTFPTSHSLSTSNGNYVSSVGGGSAISMSEALKTANSSTQPPHLPQQIAVHPYSPPTHLNGPFMSYPYLPQSYSYMPSAFQQSFAGNNNSYHQSLAALLPQYKNSISVSSQPQSNSGYGNLGSSTNYAMNNPPAPSGSGLNYDELLSSQYKESGHFLQLQHQNESPPMWQGSRGDVYYNYQTQNQQASGFRQQAQSYGGAGGYPNFYHSQAGISGDGSQGRQQQQQQPKQSQMWPRGY